MMRDPGLCRVTPGLKLFLTRLILFLIILPCFLAVVSIWWPSSLGRQVWWNLVNGTFETRLVVLSKTVARIKEASGTERLFLGSNLTNAGRLVLVFEHSLLQPERSASEYARVFHVSKLIAQSVRFQELTPDERANVVSLVQQGRAEELRRVYESMGSK